MKNEPRVPHVSLLRHGSHALDWDTMIALVEDDANPTGYAQVLDELQNGAVTRSYSYGLQRISQTQVVSNAVTTSYYGYDGGGNVRQLTNASGTVTDSYDYDAFGNQLNTTGNTPNVYLYRGEQYDADLGLYYLRARYMNPVTGRFVSQDPENGILTDPKTLHKYLYASTDPVDRIDPSGRADVMEFGDLMKVTLLVAATATYVQMTHTMTQNGSLGALGITIACSLNSDASKLSAALGWALAGGGGEIIQVGPCTWAFSSRKKQSDPVPYPPPTNPGPGNQPNGCGPCPPPIPAWCAPGNDHGSTSGFHFHWYVWDQIPAPDCRCIARRMSGPTCP